MCSYCFSQSELARQLERVRAEKNSLMKKQKDVLDEKLETEGRLSALSDDLRQSQADLRSSQAELVTSREQLLEKSKRCVLSSCITVPNSVSLSVSCLLP